jgi:peptidoglycan L-alanyl-D-glutamate endopeptidase CwlK
VSNFRLSSRSLDKLQGVHADLVKVVKASIKSTEVDFAVFEGIRTVARQRQMVNSGASQTMNSRHITGHAVDLVPWNGELRWDLGMCYYIAESVRTCAEELDISVVWGGAWVVLNGSKLPVEDLVAKYVARRRREGKKAFIDAVHFELDKLYYP